MAQNSAPENPIIKLFLCGDVMTGRGIDQILPHSVDPQLYEPYVKNAGAYVKLAEKENGPISSPVSYDYIWGDALQVWQEMDPDLKIINLETSVTTHDEPWPGKGIHYRMHPKNISVLTAAEIDFCSLANNHILDWQRPGLAETLQVLDEHNIEHAGAGKDILAAVRPAEFNLPQGKTWIFAYGMESSGVYESWSPGAHQSGVNILPDLSQTSVQIVEAQIKEFARPEDLVIVSIHWGGNWGYPIPQRQQDFAHQLIDHAEVDLIPGHSSHHPKGLEVYKEKLIIYGAGDFINDYEGISGQESYRDDLCLMYFPQYNNQTHQLNSLLLVPMQIKNMQLNKPETEDVEWLLETMQRECEPFGLAINLKTQNIFQVKW